MMTTPSESNAKLKVVSLLPSLTEIICSIGGGLEEHLVGVTHECDYPPEVVARCERVTTSDINPHKMSQEEIDRRVRGSLSMGHSLYGLREDTLKRVDPTIVFTQALCDVCAPAYPMVISTCSRVLGDEPRIISIEPGSVAEVIDSVRLVGRETGFVDEGEAEAQRLEAGFARIREVVGNAEGCKSLTKKKVAFLEWLEPLFNGGHWVPDLVRAAGGEYTMAEPCNKSVRITHEELTAYDADVILVAPCGMDRVRAKSDGTMMWRFAWWRDLRAVKNGQVFALDGNAYYARPGPRLLQGSGIIARLLHGDAVGDAIGKEISPRDSWDVICGEEPPSTSPLSLSFVASAALEDN